MILDVAKRQIEADCKRKFISNVGFYKLILLKKSKDLLDNV